jgi:2'-5' RNA ligase
VTDAWRCFVGVWIGPTLRDELATLREGWLDRPDLAGLRWSAPETWHVTLAFIGETDPASLPILESRLARVAADHAPLRVPTGGLGAFPSPARARVAWYGIGDPSGRLAALAGDVARAAGVEADPFNGHVTLAHAGRQRLDLQAWVLEKAPARSLAIDSFELVRSHPGGQARYESVATFALGAPTA